MSKLGEMLDKKDFLFYHMEDKKRALHGRRIRYVFYGFPVWCIFCGYFFDDFVLNCCCF